MGLFKRNDLDEMDQMFRQERKQRFYKAVKVFLALWMLWEFVCRRFLFPGTDRFTPLLVCLAVAVLQFFFGVRDDIKRAKEQADAARAELPNASEIDPDAFTEADKPLVGTLLFWGVTILLMIWLFGSLLDVLVQTAMA